MGNEKYGYCVWCTRWYPLLQHVEQPLYRPDNWCGYDECVEGRAALLRRYTVEQIVVFLKMLRMQYRGDPIAWDGRTDWTLDDEVDHNIRANDLWNIKILILELDARGHMARVQS
jgi:hypothetical protein